MNTAEAVAAYEAQPVLQPGEPGWWEVWGASPQDIRPGDLVLLKGGDSIFVQDTFLAKAHPIRVGLISDGEKCTLGVLCPIALIRQGTRNTLA